MKDLKGKHCSIIIVAGPPLANIGGVAAHMRSLLNSDLAREFNIMFLEVGAQNLYERAWSRARRVLCKGVMLYRLLRQYPAPVLHLNPSMDTKALLRDLLLGIIGKLGGAKLFMQFHGGRLHRVKWVSWPLFRQLLYAVLKQADLITVLSQEQLASIHAVYSDRCERLKLQCLPALFLDVASYRRPESGHSCTDSVHFLFLGRVIRVKGIFEIIEAFEQVRQEMPKAVLAIAGTGPDLEAVRELCDRKSLLSNVEFLGFVSGVEKIAVLHQSDVFLLPTYAEGLPYALLEAMAAGLPVIASPSGAIGEILQDGIHGFLVPPGNPQILAEKMLLLARDADLRKTIGQTNQAYTEEHFSLERQREVFRQIYQKLLNGT